MGLLEALAAIALAALIGAIIGCIWGEKTGEERERAKPRTTCLEFTLAVSTKVFAQYVPVTSGPTFTTTRDELARHLDLNADAAWPRRIEVCTTIDGGVPSQTVRALK